MADGDIIPGQPNGFYRNTYERLCEGKYTPDEFAWDVMGALRKNLLSKEIGNKLVDIAKCLGEYLDKEKAKDNRDFCAIEQKLEQIINQWNSGNYYEKQIVFRAAQNILHVFRYNEKSYTNNLSEAILKQCIEELYQFNFEARIDPTFKQHNNMSITALNQDVKDIQPYCSKTIGRWAKKAIKTGDFSKIKRSPRPKIKKIDLNEDLQ